MGARTLVWTLLICACSARSTVRTGDGNTDSGSEGGIGAAGIGGAGGTASGGTGGATSGGAGGTTTGGSAGTGGSAAGDGGPGGSAGAAGGTGGRNCDPGKPFEKPAPLATVPQSINTALEEAWPRISRDGKTLYFVRSQLRDGGRLLGGDIVHISRSHPDESFDEATTATEPFTAALNNEAAFLSPNGLRLYFSTALDRIYVSERASAGGAFPYPGQQLDFTSAGIRDVHPYLIGDNVVYFASTRGGNPNAVELYRSERTTVGTFAEPRAVNIAMASPGQQFAPVVSSDERVVFFSADGTIYRAVRDTADSFGMAIPADDLNGGISYPGSLSADDCVIYFHSERPGGSGFDIWFSRATATIGGD